MIQLRPARDAARRRRRLGRALKAANVITSSGEQPRLRIDADVGRIVRAENRHTISLPKYRSRPSPRIQGRRFNSIKYSISHERPPSLEQLRRHARNSRSAQLYKTCSKSLIVRRHRRQENYPPGRREPLTVGKYRRTDCSLDSLDRET